MSGAGALEALRSIEIAIVLLCLSGDDADPRSRCLKIYSIRGLYNSQREDPGLSVKRIHLSTGPITARHTPLS